MATARESTSNLPAGLLVHGAPEALARMFGALIPLQPVAWTDAGLLCAPHTAPDEARAALAACPAPVTAVPPVRIWPEDPCRLVAGWYRRGPLHAPAPTGTRELVQAPGGGFGPGDHPTTAMCLEAIDRLPPGPAVDVGCGSGLLTQAWARLGRGHVLAVDADPAAVAQTRASVDLAGVGGIVETRLQAIETLRPRDLASVTILANIPLAAHRALRLTLQRPPRSAVVSGFRPSEAPEILAGYRDMGMRRIRSMRRGRFECHVFARMR